MPPDEEGCTFGQVSRNKIENMGAMLDELKGWMQRLDESMKEALKRPGWPTLAIIAFLSSAVVGLLVALASEWARNGSPGV